VRAGEADILLKGAVSTAVLIHAVLDRDTGLRTGRLLSDVFVIDYSGRGPGQLVGITDGGINPTPDVQQKEAILRNAVQVFHALGIEEPRVAVLSGTEKPTPRLQGSMDAARLAELYEAGEIRECVVDGPLAMDMALSTEAAALKGIVSPVAGRADILLFPTLEAANITAKAIQYWTSQDPGHVVVGAAAPCSSRHGPRASVPASTPSHSGRCSPSATEKSNYPSASPPSFPWLAPALTAC